MTVGLITAKVPANYLMCRPSDFMDETLDRMVGMKESAIMVTERTGEIVGLLTDEDMLRAVQARAEVGDSIAREHVFAWMTEHPTKIDVNATLEEALAIMDREKLRHLIVTKEGQPVCIIGISDVLTAIHEKDVTIIHEMRGIIFTAPTKPTALAS